MSHLMQNVQSRPAWRLVDDRGSLDAPKILLIAPPRATGAWSRPGHLEMTPDNVLCSTQDVAGQREQAGGGGDYVDAS